MLPSPNPKTTENMFVLGVTTTTEIATFRASASARMLASCCLKSSMFPTVAFKGCSPTREPGHFQSTMQGNVMAHFRYATAILNRQQPLQSRALSGGRCRRRGQLSSPPCRCRCPWPAPAVLARSCRVRRPGDPASCARCPLALELAVAGELVLDDVEPSPDALADHGAFEFAEGARNLKQQLAHRRCKTHACANAKAGGRNP